MRLRKFYLIKEIDRVVIIAPRKVVEQWRDDFKLLTGRTILVLEGKMADVGVDVCATWSKIKNDVPLFQLMCQKDRVLVICDEHHHRPICYLGFVCRFSI